MNNKSQTMTVIEQNPVQQKLSFRGRILLLMMILDNPLEHEQAVREEERIAF
jgi:hypothetical protein